MKELLTSWKEIAGYLGRTPRTVQRWEREFNLPVHRPAHKQSRIVVADTDEIDQWATLHQTDEADVNLPTLEQIDPLKTHPRHSPSEHNQILQSIARREPSSAILPLLVNYIEETLKCDFAEILLIDGRTNRLLHIAGSKVPKSLINSPDLGVIGPVHGTCGTAAYRGKRIISTCTQSDPKWSRLRGVANKHALAACWATPIFSSRHVVIGVVSAYFGRKIKPTDDSLTFLELAGYIAGLGLQFNGLDETLESFEKQAAFIGVDRNFVVRAMNNEASQLLGRSPSEMIGIRLWDLYPDAINTQFYREYKKALDGGIAVAFEDYSHLLAMKFSVVAKPSNDGLVILFREVSVRSKRAVA